MFAKKVTPFVKIAKTKFAPLHVVQLSTGSSPNLAIQHLLKDLPAYCPNFKNGCQQISSDSENHEDHMRGCVHREVHCPSFFCQSQIFEFKDLSEHVTFFHTKEHLDDFMKSTENKFDITYGHFFDSDDNKLLSKLDVSNPWIPRQLMTTDGSVFYAVARIVNHSVYHWIYFLGSPHEVIFLTTFYNTYHLNIISFLSLLYVLHDHCTLQAELTLNQSTCLFDI